ncbi:MAG: hypothetical protein WC653_05980, partial [Candidatus Gracilibacteria bacterium]
MKIRLFVPFLAAVLLFSACSSVNDTPTESATGDYTESVVNVTAATESSVSGVGVEYTVNYDTSKWKMTAGASSGDAEYEFEHVDGDVYALIIAERIEVDAASLKEIALANAQSIADDATVVFEKGRTVNGIPMEVMKIDGTAYGVAFEYYGYYYSGPAGTIQFITYTSSNLTSTYEADLTELL